jgi:hypothetical protein
METIGQKLAVLKEASGLSLSAIAKAGGWSGASSVQKYFEPQYDHPLRSNVAEAFSRSLGPSVYEACPAPGRQLDQATVSDVVGLLRNAAIPSDVRCAAAAERLSQMARVSPLSG